MAIGIPQDEIHAFYDFLGRRIEKIGGALSPEEGVQEFRLYQEELNRFVEETQPAIEQSQRGEARPLDVDAQMQRVKDRLAKLGSQDSMSRAIWTPLAEAELEDIDYYIAVEDGRR